jgi:hypothetical protein
MQMRATAASLLVFLPLFSAPIFLGFLKLWIGVQPHDIIIKILGEGKSRGWGEGGGFTQTPAVIVS